jgi:asparagine synthase (glutamine-hydrolysing)
MCGIVAVYAARGAVEAEAVERATRRLAHRGPDGRRVWVSDDRRAALGHARLSIIDLATGDQPIASEDGSRQITVNGEFYDFERIRRGLERRSHRFRTRSDSEVALHLYEDHGPGCLDHLRGEFAFALWDGPRGTLFAARDRFGIKPLFYAERDGVLWLASEAKALFAAGVPARWDHEAFFQAGHLTVPHPDRSLFDGVRQVPPGYYLEASGSGVRLTRYWDFDYPAADEATPRLSDAEAAGAFRDALDKAVRLRLRADVPVGCYLSGGLDSCAVLGLAALHCDRPVRAFTLTFDRPDYDEGAIARATAERVGAEFTPIPVTQADLADDFADAVAQAETLCANAHGVAKYRLSRAVRDAGYKVVLTGEGSDEILAGYPHFRRDMLLHNAQGQDPGEVRRLLDELRAVNPVSRGLLLPEGDAAPLARVRDALGFVPSWVETNATTAFKLRALFSDEFSAAFAGRDAYGEFLDGLDVPGQLAGREPVHQALYLWSKTWLPNYVLTVLGDRMEMAHSIEGRVPFLDHELVELARDLPVSQKIRGAVEKYVLREAARPVLTAEVYGRHKHPFLSPPAAQEPEGRLHALLQDTLRGPALGALPFFDRGRVVALLDRLPAMDPGERAAHDPALMAVLSACVLQQRLGLGDGPAEPRRPAPRTRAV